MGVTFVKLFILSILIFSFSPEISKANNLSTDIRFILQTQGGLTAYTSLSHPIALPHAKQLLSTIETETDSFVFGNYTLSGRTETVKLAISKEGWLIAFHPPDYASQQLLDCHNSNTADWIVGQPERAILEAAAALGEPEPTIGFYDVRHPEASTITLHWLYTAKSDTLNSTLYLPLDNLYLERGYAFCTALTNSKLYLNDALIDSQGGVYSLVKRWGALDSGQLRAGQNNTMQISALSFFGTGFFAGISTVYEGDAEIIMTDGYSRTLKLEYPPMIGEPLEISGLFLPMISK
jgi:hypothetical protein